MMPKTIAGVNLPPCVTKLIPIHASSNFVDCARLDTPRPSLLDNKKRQLISLTHSIYRTRSINRDSGRE